MENIKLKKSSILKIGIQTDEGIDTGNYLEFDLEDLELPFRLQKCQDEHDKNIKDLKAKFLIIDKKQDSKGNRIMSKNEEEKIKTLQDFYKKEMNALDLFLGEKGTEKLLNGRKPYIQMFDDISEYLKPILPILQKTTDDIQNNIIKKYKKKDDDIIE